MLIVVLCYFLVINWKQLDNTDWKVLNKVVSSFTVKIF